MSDKPAKSDQKSSTSRNSASEGRDDKSANQGLAEKSVTEHHVPGADGPSGAEAEEDNNP